MATALETTLVVLSVFTMPTIGGAMLGPCPFDLYYSPEKGCVKVAELGGECDDEQVVCRWSSYCGDIGEGQAVRRCKCVDGFEQSPIDGSGFMRCTPRLPGRSKPIRWAGYGEQCDDKTLCLDYVGMLNCRNGKCACPDGFRSRRPEERMDSIDSPGLECIPDLSEFPGELSR